MRKKNLGFTLIEILIVIAIISILAAMIVVLAGQMTVKAQTQGTQAEILAIVTACNNYRTDFAVYPDVNQDMSKSNSNEQTVPYPGSNKSVLSGVDDANTTEWNHRLRFLLESQAYLVDEVVRGPYLDGDLPDDEDPDNERLYVDLFNNPLLVVPGRDHSGNNPPGPNNFNSANRASHLPDIYSMGADAQDDVGLTGTSFTSTGAFDAEDSDDIVSWALEQTK